MGLRESEMTEQLSLHFANNQRMAATSVIIKPYLHIQGIKEVQGRLASSFFFFTQKVEILVLKPKQVKSIHLF